MLEALISHLDRDEARVPVPPEGPSCTPDGTGSVHQELEKVKFLSYLVPQTTLIWIYAGTQ
jgi:hypothetical protein